MEKTQLVDKNSDYHLIRSQNYMLTVLSSNWLATSERWKVMVSVLSILRKPSRDVTRTCCTWLQLNTSSQYITWLIGSNYQEITFCIILILRGQPGSFEIRNPQINDLQLSTNCPNCLSQKTWHPLSFCAWNVKCQATIDTEGLGLVTWASVPSMLHECPT